MFEDWFVQVVIPFCRGRNGKKVIIGDNLSSHLSPLVVQLCLDNDIEFAFLPKNSTHICQPLDVAFFKPLKVSWRKILGAWKVKHTGAPTLPKADFPKHLKLAVDSLKSSHNLKAGFKKCGIYPFSREELLSQLPEEHAAETQEAAGNKESVSATLIEFLKEKRFGNPDDGERVVKRTKAIQVQPGKSVSLEELERTPTPGPPRKRPLPGSWSAEPHEAEPLKLKLKLKK